MSPPYEAANLGPPPYVAVDLGNFHITETTPVVVGPRGPQGPAGDGAIHSHHQETPSASWIINHNLGRKKEPLVLLDSDPTIPVFTDVQITDADTLTLSFPTPVTGWAHIN